MLCAALALASSGKEAGGGLSPSVPAPGWRLQILWLGLAACGSALLLAITHHISQNIASVPLLWIIPLALYLLTFILCFGGRVWYRRDFFLRLLAVALGSMAYALSPSFAILPLAVSIPLFCCSLFVCCMFCHGELAGLKPHPAHLTSFYLMSSLGGALGALFVAWVAPHLFPGNYELRVAIGCCAVLVLVVLYRDPQSPFYRARWLFGWLLISALALAIIVSLGISAEQEARSARLMVRNFYGVLRVINLPAPEGVSVKGRLALAPGEDPRCEKLMNGPIDHGLQFTSPARRRLPTTYYGPDSGVGIALRAAEAKTPLRVGVIGLGVGTLAAYAMPGDHYKFYEINPLVVQVAQEDFTFLRDSPAQIETVLGDGRLSLEHEPPQGFDVLVVDAFSGDSIPVHLLSRQAFQLYFRHLNPHGVLALHISNQYLNLAPVVTGAALGLGKEAVEVESKADRPQGVYRATWVLVGDRQGFLGREEIERAGELLTASSPQIQWTDDYSSLFKILM